MRLTVTPTSTTDATLFVGLRDVSSDGTNTASVAARRAGAPDRADAGQADARSRVRLPSIVHTVPSGHRLVLTVATTDFAYQLPQDARTYTIALDGLPQDA